MSEDTTDRDAAERFMEAVEGYGGGKRDGEGRIVVDSDDVGVGLSAALKHISPASLDRDEVAGVLYSFHDAYSRARGLDDRVAVVRRAVDLICGEGDNE